MVLFESSCQLRTFRSGLAHVQQYQIEGILFETFDRLVGAGCRHHRQTQLVELGCQRIDQPHILVHQQHTLPGGRHL